MYDLSNFFIPKKDRINRGDYYWMCLVHAPYHLQFVVFERLLDMVVL